MTEVKITLGEINQLGEPLSKIIRAKLSFGYSFKLFKLAKNLDEANEYFIKNYNDIKESGLESIEMDNKIAELVNTVVTIDVDDIDASGLYSELANGDIKISPYVISQIDRFLIHDEEPSGFHVGE